MPLTDIDLGTGPNTDTGTNARDAGSIINANFAFLKTLIDNNVTEVENTYSDITALLADQANQNVGKIQYVLDASADPNITSGQAHYEKLTTSTAILADDYRLLTAEESLILITTAGTLSAKIDTIDTTLAVSVNPNKFHVQYENVGNKITNILINKIHTNYFEGWAAVIGTKVLQLSMVNWTKGTVLVAKINSFTYSDGSNKYYDIALENSIDVADVSTKDYIAFQISVSPFVELNIDGYWVDKKGNTDLTDIEVGDQIRGNFSVGRYIIADVAALPHTTEANLEFYLDTEK